MNDCHALLGWICEMGNETLDSQLDAPYMFS